MLVVLVAALVVLIAQTTVYYDSATHLLWADQVLRGGSPGFSEFMAPTQHPLWLAYSLIARVVAGGESDRFLVVTTVASYLAFLLAVLKCGRLLSDRRRLGFSIGLVAALICGSSQLVVLLALGGSVDIPFLALTMWGVVLVLSGEGKHWLPGLLMFAAGLLRPEAWVFALILGIAALLRNQQQQPETIVSASWRAIILCFSAPLAMLIWASIDLWITGNPVHSWQATRELAEVLGRETGIENVPSSAKSGVQEVIGNTPAQIGVAAMILLFVSAAFRLGTTRLNHLVSEVSDSYSSQRRSDGSLNLKVGWAMLALIACALLVYAALGIGGLSLLPRYLLLPSVLLALLCSMLLHLLVLVALRSRFRVFAVLSLAACLTLLLQPYAELKFDQAETVQREIGYLQQTRDMVNLVATDPRVISSTRCGPISLPNQRMLPELTMALRNSGQYTRVVARSDPHAAHHGIKKGGAAITIVGTNEQMRRFVRAGAEYSVSEAPPTKFKKLFTHGILSVWTRC